MQDMQQKQVLQELSSQNTVVEGMPATAEEVFYTNWGRETLKESLSFVNEVLRQLVTLNVALLGGSVAFLDNAIIQAGIRNVVIFMFFLSLFVSILGILPYEKEIDISSPEEVKEYKLLAHQIKRRYLWVSSSFLIAGFAVAVGGILMHW